MLRNLFFRKKEKSPMEDNTINILQLRREGEELYRNRDFFCSEAVIKVILNHFPNEFDDNVIKLASGFPVGIGGSMCTCGAVNAGVMAIGMFFGRNQSKGKEVKKTMLLSKELYEEFTKTHKVACCKVLTKGKELGSKEHLTHCVNMTGEVVEITGRILARELGYKILEK